MNNEINFPHTSIQRTKKKLQHRLYRKQTPGNKILHDTLYYPIEHKISAINYMINKINRYPMCQNGTNKEITQPSIGMYNTSYESVPKRKLPKNKLSTNVGP
jgi:hypothetical protein